MGIRKVIYRLFGDTIEYRDIGKKIIIIKHNKPGVYIKKGSRIRMRKEQCAVILKENKLYSVLRPGTYYLFPEIFPELEDDFGKGFKSIVDIDFYVLNQKVFKDNPWSNKNPISLRDKDFKFVQLRAFGTFSFRISNPEKFISEVFINKKKYFTCNILLHISSFVSRAVEECVSQSGLRVTELMNSYKKLEEDILKILQREGQAFGVEYMDVRIDNLSIPVIIQQLLEDKMWKEIESRYNGEKQFS